MSFVTDGLYNLHKHNYLHRVPSVETHVRVAPGFDAVSAQLDTLRANDNAPDAFWLVGSRLYTPLLQSRSVVAGDWNVVYRSGIDGLSHIHDLDMQREGWNRIHDLGNAYAYWVKDGISLMLHDSRFMVGAHAHEDTHPAVDYLAKAPISTWCLASEWGSADIIQLPQFQEAADRGVIDVHNQGSFLEYVKHDREWFRTCIARVAGNTGFIPDGEVLALLDLTMDQFDNYRS